MNRDTLPGRSLAALPLGFGLHVLEEWFGGFPAWTGEYLGKEVAVERFLVINGVALFVVALVMFAAVRHARLLAAALIMSTVLTLNGALHVLATLAFRVYSPGVVTGVLLYIPLGGSVLLWTFRSVSSAQFASILFAAVVVHALVSLIAFG